MSYKKKLIVFSIFFVFFILFSCISFWRYNTGQVFYYDFGHFVRVLWLISRFTPPIIQHKVLGEINFLGDHFSPSLYVLAPLFWITTKTQILLLEQAFFTVLSGFLIFVIAKKERLSLFSALTTSLLFLLFAGTENPLVTDWHTESTAATFLLLFIYLFIYKNKRLLAIICALIFIGFKDSNPLSLIFILLPFFIEVKTKRLSIFLILLMSLVYFLIITCIVSPSISKQPYLYSPILPNHLLAYFTNFINLQIKRKLIFDSLLSFGLLPILSGFFLLPIIGELSIRLVPEYIHSQSFTLGMHYNVYLGVFLAIASIKALVFTNRLFLKTRFNMPNIIPVLVLLIALFVAKKITNSPINLATNKIFLKEWNNKTELYKEIFFVPKYGSIMSQNNILPHLLQRREKVFLLSLEYTKFSPTTIVFDLFPGQNINNYYSGEIQSIKQVEQLKLLLLKDHKYQRLITPYNELFIFRKL